MSGAGPSFGEIRMWRGSQDQAFEELCFQLRDREMPEGSKLIKTGYQDGGLEWYLELPNGELWGWQAKYIDDASDLLGAMKKSLKTVAAKRPTCTRLTFCVAMDLSDAPGRSTREKFEDDKVAWAEEIDGAEKIVLDLIGEGELLERLTSHPEQRGIEWFFWQKEVFSPEWSKQQLKRVRGEVGPRYNPHLNVAVPIEKAIEGLARSDDFHKAFRSARGAVVRALTKLNPTRYESLERKTELETILGIAEAWMIEVPSSLDPWELPNNELWLERTNAMFGAITKAQPGEVQPADKDKPAEEERALVSLGIDLRRDLSRVEDALGAFAAFARSAPARAAETRSLFILGEAGQGKTHLICDVANRMREEGQPVAIILGNRCSGHNVWAEVERQMGVGSIGTEQLLQGMRSAAEAADKPFLLLFDALNESGDAYGWQNELPAVLAELADSPWVVVGFTVRSEYEEVVIPPRENLPPTSFVTHPGFAGREVEAAEKFFEFYKIDAQVPDLDPAFANPLFLTIYCKGLEEEGATAPPPGSESVRAVFDRYVAKVSREIDKRLKLDGRKKTVENAVEALSAELLARGTDSIPYLEAMELLDGFAKDRTEWPNTVTGQMLAEGLLSRDFRWSQEAYDYCELIRFSFQRFSDFHIAESLIADVSSAEELAKVLGSDDDRVKRFESARAGWIAALSVLLPEQLGVELLSAHTWDLTDRKEIWQREFMSSLVTRHPSAVSADAVELFESIQMDTRNLYRQALDSMVAVASRPDHPLNADRLHDSLLKLPMPERDFVWTTETYYDLDADVPLGRLIHWAARVERDVDGEVARLAAIPLVWTFTSPNRRLRDYTTKALATFMSGHIPELTKLVNSFEQVDDPYVVERLAVAAHGSLLLARPFPMDNAKQLLRALESLVLDPSRAPDQLARDAVRGCAELCWRSRLINDSEFERFKPPYGADPPNEPPPKEELDEKYDRDNKDPKTGKTVRNPYGVFSSAVGFADFGRYVLQPKVRYFSQLPLSETRPEKFERDDPAEQFPLEFAQRWMVDRSIGLGWKPEYFKSFDQSAGYSNYGRSGHKPETFAKKYLWVALRELVARLADNFHMSDSYYGTADNYEGAWQFGRDIDPTLPPAERSRDDEDEFVTGDTFARDSAADSWWVPPLPVYAAESMPVADDWATTDSEYPEMKDLVLRDDREGNRWVVLQSYFNCDEEIPEDQDRFESPRRDLWAHIIAWVVRNENRDEIVEWLESRSHVGGELARGAERTDASYLGEMPWSDSLEFTMAWEPIEEFGSDDVPECEVIQARIGYLWEGNIWDCSIEDSVHVMLPAPIIYEVAQLEWIPRSRSWAAENGQVVAQYRESADTNNSALLVRESWLSSLLAENDWSLVVAWIGEKQLVAGGITGGLIGNWTLVDGAASLTEGDWVFGERRLAVREQAG